MAIFYGRTLVWELCGLAAFVSCLAGSADDLYYFVDERDVSHFSNVPGDPRYRPLPSTGNLSAQQPFSVSVPALDAQHLPRAGPRECAQSAGPRAPVLDAAYGAPEPDTPEPLPEDNADDEMLTDDVPAPAAEVTRPPGQVPSQNR